MGKRSRNQPVDITVEEEIEKAEKEYRGLKRLFNLGAFAVALLILGLILQQPGGWLIAVVILGLIEGVSYFFLRRSLEQRREERIARIRHGE